MPKDNQLFLTDQAVLAEIGSYLSTRRLAADMTQAQLAERAGVSKRTLERAEAGESIQLITFVRLLRELGLLSQFQQGFSVPSPSPMQQLAEKKGTYKTSKKQRVRQSEASNKNWEWGEGA